MSCITRIKAWDTLAVQWLKLCLAMKGTLVRSLVWEDLTCLGATKPVRHNYWAHVTEPMLRTKRSHRNEKPVLRNQRMTLAPNRRKPLISSKDPAQPKIKKKKKKEKKRSKGPWQGKYLRELLGKKQRKVSLKELLPDAKEWASRTEWWGKKGQVHKGWQKRIYYFSHQTGSSLRARTLASLTF